MEVGSRTDNDIENRAVKRLGGVLNARTWIWILDSVPSRIVHRGKLRPVAATITRFWTKSEPFKPLSSVSTEILESLHSKNSFYMNIPLVCLQQSLPTLTKKVSL